MYVSTQFRRLAQKSRSALVVGALTLCGAFAAPSLAQTQVNNTATVTLPATVVDTNTTNNTSTVNVAVVAPRLEMTKVASVGAGNPFTVGVPASYTLTLRNTGTTATTATATITDTVPAGFTINSASGCAISGQTVSCTVAAGLSNVAPGNTASFTINVTPTTASAGVTNTATASGGGDATCPATTARCASSVTNPVQQLTVAISDAATVTEGSNLVYTVTLSGGTSTSAITIPVTYTGTATNGVDYTNVVNVTIAAGSTTATLTVPTATDTIAEGNETVIANLGTPSQAGVTVTDASGTGTITDVAPTLTVNITGTPTAAEGADLVYTVELTGGTSTQDIVT
ncbi:hypothetical protein MMG85_05865, partial [Pseudoxanthomonas sp. LH2527]|uniref:Calx-beta domain-containing protein n=1 Tax=Pseudoxanthomonas sp. LH2527 TaxID=2923249 RepID=UPI001F13F7C8|nr:hypothetical protein [Pseudoxanthomonas sp. LH2527]